jgi:hypothetical protein
MLIGAWLAVVSFGLIMCRLAARSDDAHAVEVAEWIVVRHIAGSEPTSAGGPPERLPFDPRQGLYRATGSS